jgi:hypothetical protein
MNFAGVHVDSRRGRHGREAHRVKAPIPSDALRRAGKASSAMAYRLEVPVACG